MIGASARCATRSFAYVVVVSGQEDCQKTVLLGLVEDVFGSCVAVRHDGWFALVDVVVWVYVGRRRSHQRLERRIGFKVLKEQFMKGVGGTVYEGCCSIHMLKRSARNKP